MHTIIPPDNLDRAFAQLRADPESFSVESFSQNTASISEVSESTIVRLKEKILRLYGDADITNIRSPEWIRIDGETAALLHSDLSELDAKIALSSHFWTFISLYMREVIYRRHCYGSWAALKEEHFGTSIIESLLPRLWHRAYISIDLDNTDPYWLTKRGGSDYWRSFVLRAIYAQSPQLIRALTRFLYDPEHSTFRMGEFTAKSDIIRELGPEIRKQHSITPFEVLTENECLAVIRALACDLGIVPTNEAESIEAGN